MNKKFKIAAAAVSVVMAGTMAFGMFGCTQPEEKVKPSVDANGQLTWAAGTKLNMNVGNSNSTAPQGIAYTEQDLSGSSVMPDGKTYSAGDLKPAWAALQTQLSKTSAVEIVDKYQNLSSNAQVSTPISQKNLTEYDVITGSLEEINKNSSAFLNLADYLDYMPNYKAFLEANPVTRYSLTGDQKGGMYAAPYFDGNDDIEKYSMMNRNWVKLILDSPDADLATFVGTFKSQAEAKKESNATDYAAVVSTKASATAYMGTTGSYEVLTTDPATADQKIPGTTTLKVNYTAAHDAAVGTSALATAIEEAAGEKYTGESGNIVDLQNFAINKKNGEVTGAQLAKILREYIKVAYQTSTGSAFYTTLSDVFVSAYAGWDVDLLVAMSRCVVTCVPGHAKADARGASDVFAISARQTTTQRRVDLMALAGELYGVRGLESRYEYAYFDKDGQIKDARADADTYDTINNFSNLTKEGLVYIGSNDMTKKYTVKTKEELTKPKSEGGEYGYTLESDGCYYLDGVKKADEKGQVLDDYTLTAASVNTNNKGKQTFMLHDYVQTQTKAGMGLADTAYNFAPVLNAVSKWDTNGDGTRETYMRFTESWRSVKNTGFCIPLDSVKNDADKLAAVLAFVDYMFSTDGQLLMSYGPQSTTGDTNPNGWWYATEVTGKTAAEVGTKVADATNYAPAQYTVKSEYKTQYFIYNEKVYTGTDYNGTQVPTLTELNAKFYHGKEIEIGDVKIKQGGGNIKVSKVDDYTNYARYIIGSTLPIGNKNQGFEYQATASAGINGAAVVTKALLNKTVKHVKLTLDEGESPWYLIVPTSFPLTKSEQETLKDANQTKISGTYFYNNSKTNQVTNICIDLLYYGLGSSAYVCGQESYGSYSQYNTGAKIVTMLNDGKFNERVGVMKNGWYTVNHVYNLGYNLD